MTRRLSLLLTGLLTGCTAVKSTVHLTKAEQALQLAREAAAPVNAPYAWTAAEELVLKAREEWAASDFGPAEDLSVKAVDAANKAAEQAKTAPTPLDIPPWATLPDAAPTADAPAAPATVAAPPAPAPAPAPASAPNEPWADGTVTESPQSGGVQ